MAIYYVGQPRANDQRRKLEPLGDCRLTGQGERNNNDIDARNLAIALAAGDYGKQYQSHYAGLVSLEGLVSVETRYELGFGNNFTLRVYCKFSDGREIEV